MCVPMAMAFVERAIHHSPEWKAQNTPIHCRRRPDGATNSKLSQHTHTANNTLCSRSHSLWCDVLCCAVHHQWQQSIIIMNRYRFIIRYSIWYFPFGRSSISWVRYRLLASTKYPNINLLWLVGVLFVEKEIRSESYCKSDEKLWKMRELKSEKYHWLRKILFEGASKFASSTQHASYTDWNMRLIHIAIVLRSLRFGEMHQLIDYESAASELRTPALFLIANSDGDVDVGRPELQTDRHQLLLWIHCTSVTVPACIICIINGL